MSVEGPPQQPSASSVTVVTRRVFPDTNASSQADQLSLRVPTLEESVLLDRNKRIEVLTTKCIAAETEKNRMYREFETAKASFSEQNASFQRELHQLTEQLSHSEEESAAHLNELQLIREAAASKDAEFDRLTMVHKSTLLDLNSLRESTMAASNDKLEVLRLEREVERLQGRCAELESQVDDLQLQQIRQQQLSTEQLQSLEAEKQALVASHSEALSSAEQRARAEIDGLKNALHQRDDDITKLLSQLSELHEANVYAGLGEHGPQQVPSRVIESTRTSTESDGNAKIWVKEPTKRDDTRYIAQDSSSDDSDEVEPVEAAAPGERLHAQLSSALHNMRTLRHESRQHTKRVRDKPSVLAKAVDNLHASLDPRLAERLMHLLQFSTKEELLKLVEHQKVELYCAS
jgi:seryl-tRNA synthetase